MERLKERLAVARRALALLDELASRPTLSKIERDAAIQRFEFTFEATWKAVQRHLEVVEGVIAGSPKACVRSSRDVGVLDDEQATLALEMVDDRNLSVHTYDEALAERIRLRIPSYASLLRVWIDALGSPS
jgi:nucleotidyltransferase substrate binding protein (TIGR01987 family)